MRNPISLPPPPAAIAKPLGLSDGDYDIVLNAIRPLAPDRRDIFLQEVAEVVRQTGASGGALYRAIREIQARHFDFPDLEHHRSAGKYGRAG
jgi:hypothetical protein